MSNEAIIAKIDLTEEIPNANTIQVGYVLGETVVVGKDSKAGDIGVFFPADLQLSEKYCYYNNLYRHSELNEDDTKKGFFDDNRKVRAQKFMKVKSDGYFAPLDSLAFTGYDISKLSVGDKFTTLNDVEICKKFISKQSQQQIDSRKQKKKSKIETPLFHEHVDTEQLKYYLDSIPIGAIITLHAKLHGTSARYTNTLVKRPPQNFWDKTKDALGFYKGELFCHVAGTRRVVLQQDQRDKMGFNGPEAWRLEWLDKLSEHLTPGITIYGEIVGYANGSPIMGKHSTAALKDKAYTKKYGEEIIYKYGCPPGENRFVVYRVTYTTPDGKELDFTVPQLVHWCHVRNLEHTKLLSSPFIYNGNKENLLEYVTELTEWPKVLTEDYYDPSHVNEGVVVRVDYKNTAPTFYKNKSWAFKVMEGIWKEDNVDIEDAA